MCRKKFSLIIIFKQKAADDERDRTNPHEVSKMEKYEDSRTCSS